MKKLLILLGVLLVGAAAVMPYFTGKMAETVSKDMVASLNKNSLENGVTTIEEYDRGYASSKYKVSWSPDLIDSGKDSEKLFEFDCEGNHGITSYAYQCKFAQTGAYTDFVKMAGKDPITVSGNVSMFGKVDQTIKLDAFEFQTEDNETVSVSSGELEVQTDKELRNLSMEGEFDGAQFTEKDTVFNLKGASLEGDFEIDENMLSFGDFTMTLDGMNATSKGGNGNFALEKMKLVSSTKDKGENMAVSYKITVDQIEGMSDDSAKAEKIDVSDIGFDFAVDNLNKSAIVEMMDKLQSTVDQSQKEGLSEEQNAMASGLEMMPLVEKILAKGLSIDTEAQAKISGSPVNFDFDVELMDKVGMGDFVLLSVQPDAFLKKLNAEIGMAVPQKLVDMDPSFSAMVNSGPWYQKSGDKFESNLKIKDGALSLNGKTYTVEQFQALLMQSAMQ